MQLFEFMRKSCSLQVDFKIKLMEIQKFLLSPGSGRDILKGVQQSCRKAKTIKSERTRRCLLQTAINIFCDFCAHQSNLFQKKMFNKKCVM